MSQKKIHYFRETFVGWLITAKILLLQHNQHLYLDVSVSVSEEVCSIPLPVLATIVMRRGKKSKRRTAILEPG